MKRLYDILKVAVAAFVLFVPVAQADERLDALFARLPDASRQDAQKIERQIWEIWSQSGSPAIDLLLRNGREALARGAYDRAAEHFSAAIEHAPDFAEAFNGRATAYFRGGYLGLAAADIAEVLSLNPRHFGAIAGFAAIIEQTGDSAHALRVYQEAKRLHPHLSGVDEAIKRIEADAMGVDL